MTKRELERLRALLWKFQEGTRGHKRAQLTRVLDQVQEELGLRQPPSIVTSTPSERLTALAARGQRATDALVGGVHPIALERFERSSLPSERLTALAARGRQATGEEAAKIQAERKHWLEMQSGEREGRILGMRWRRALEDDEAAGPMGAIAVKAFTWEGLAGTTSIDPTDYGRQSLPDGKKIEALGPCGCSVMAGAFEHAPEVLDGGTYWIAFHFFPLCDGWLQASAAELVREWVPDAAERMREHRERLQARLQEQRAADESRQKKRSRKSAATTRRLRKGSARQQTSES